MVHYIDHLNEGLTRSASRPQQRFLMQSNGGVMPFSAAITGGRTVHTLFSGPAAGAQASAYLAREAAAGLVTLDMGGTSCDIAFIEGGAPLETTEGIIARRQVDVPALDMTTISAGGGSIAGDRRRRFPHRRPAQRRRRSGAGLLRPRRQGADRHRRRSGVRLPQRRLFPGRQAEARCRRGARSARPPYRPAAQARRARRRRRHPPHRRHADGRRGAGVRRQARRRPVRLSRCCRSAAPARCMPRRSPTSSA